MQLRPRNRFAAALLAVVAYGLVISATGVAADLPRLTVEEFRLPNGMLFLMVRRPAMPQVACRLAIRAGSALEQTGKTGIAHMLEHMLFKGTRNFGTLDPDRDRELQAQIESTYQKIQRERSKRQPDQERIAAGLSEMATLRRQVKEIFVPQAFSSQLNRNGAVGVNAFTSRDQTQYMASVPSDMLEQWFSIVSEQVFEPSWREFYVEKEVVQREWAFRYVNSPSGAAWLDLNATAYTAHPYRNPVIGWPSDMQRFSTSDAAAFHARYYTPTNAVCVLVGDVDTQQVKEWARRYFGRYPAGPPAPRGGHQ
jgi:predicted Zn-dependent peptidase